MLELNEIQKAIRDAIPYGAEEDAKEAAIEIKEMLQRAEQQKRTQQPKLITNEK